MKASNYNFVFFESDWGYWFNSLSFRYFRISRGVSEKLVSFMDQLDEMEQYAPAFYKKLHENGFIIEDEVDELSLIQDRCDKAILSKDYFLVVLPTLNCNFKCWYCIQDHIPSKMSQTVIDALKRHVDYMIHEEKIESLTVDWFGGEPLMYYEDVVRPLSVYMKAVCDEAGISFRNGATTNGYFLPKLLDDLYELNFYQFQITLDGDKEFHDGVKFQKNCHSAFETVLSKINDMLNIKKDVNMILRINYTHSNLSMKIVEEVNKFIAPENRKSITITPKKVWQEAIDKSFEFPLREILDSFWQHGYKVERWSPIVNYIPCYANRKYYNAICHDGHVVKCTACDDLHEPSSGGQLLENGRIAWNDDFDVKYQSKTFENPTCLGCKCLPICMGRCPRDFLAGSNYCKFQSSDFDLKNSIVDLIDFAYEKS